MAVEDTQKQAAAAAEFPWEKHLTSVKIAMAKKNDALAGELLHVLLDVAQCMQPGGDVRLDLLARLGHVELRLKGSDVAKRRFESALQLAKELGLQEHPSAAYCLDGLADCFETNLEFTRSETARKKALAIAERTLGEKHQHTQMLRDRLNTLRQEHQADLYGSHVKTTFDQLLDREQQPHPQDSEQTVDKTDESVAVVMFEKYLTNAKKEIAQKNWREAENCLNSAVDKCNVFAKTDPRRYETLRLLANVLCEGGKSAQSRQCYEKALALAFDNIGAYCEETARCMDLLGDLYMREDDIVSAKNYYQQAISAYRASVGLEKAGETQKKYNALIARIQEERKWQGWSV